ncbi:two-component system sensor histidine kinase NtrB [Pseudodesulfovibrio sediminis]|uniref:histidine kinase n=1 Tax=Pseudodesulfovibrio sediminis TaxID=2810563 RepID=A0ABN6EXX5_9BACT|nr:ATP-binding protein [Pseudodesulfovibrio sediminis]BCS89683.1 PAS domain-containing sensor histidine kinase [Pseudodesulfovibrio sediminis]
MEVARREGKEKSPLVALVLALIVLGLGSLYLTWQSIAQQRKIVEDHMIMTGNSILRGVDNNILRIARTLRMGQQSPKLFQAMAEELFTELSKSEDIVFISLFGADGKPLVASVTDQQPPVFKLPDSVTQDIEPGRAWHVMAEVGKKGVLISGLRTRPGIATLSGRPGVPPEETQGDHSLEQGSRRPFRLGQGLGAAAVNESQEPPVFLVVGLNAEKHMAQYRQYKRAATYQTGYVFLAAVVLWSLVFAYLRRRGASRKLVRLERFQNTLLDNMPDGLVTLAEDGEILAANYSAKTLLTPEGREGAPEIIGSNWRDFPFGGASEMSRMSIPYGWQQYDYQGRQLEILSLHLQTYDEDAAPELGQRLVLLRDRTQIRSLEEDLNEAKRLAAIGSLAAGVAHEVRNPLSSLRGFAQLFATKLKGQAPLDQYATTMVQEADRLNRVVTDLLYLAKPRTLDPKHIDLAKVGDSIRQLMRFDFEGKQIEPEFDFGPDPLYADQDALRQVLLNLISNSLDAIEGCTDCPRPGHIHLTSERGDGGVWIIVADDGPGMDPELSDDVFKPFVTGKKTGTGLGLAIVQNIMRAHKGRAVVQSLPGEGMEVQLFFPDMPDDDQEGIDI